MNKLLRFFTMSLVVLGVLMFVLWRKWERQQRKESLVVGIVCAGYPYAAINIQGELDGFDIELAKEIAKKMGKKILFNDMPMEFLRSALKVASIDLIGSSLIMTQRNMQAMEMFDVYGKPKAELTCVFWQAIPQGVVTIENLKTYSLNKPIGAMAESAWIDVLSEHGITNIMEIEQYRELILPLKYGQASSIVVGPRHALALQKQYPEIKILKVKLDKPWAEGVGIALKKGNRDLKEKLEKIIAEFKQDGTIKKLIAKWFGEAANDC